MAGRDVKRRIASSSGISCSSRTYLPSTRGNDPHARGCDFDSENGPSSARAPESVPIEIIGFDSASRTSSSRMIEMITEVSPRSAITRSIAASRGSLPISLPISTRFLPSHLRSAGSSTVDTITPAPPPEPYHWFSQSLALASSMSRLMRSRSAGSCRRRSIMSRPPSRTHSGRHASRPFEARSYGIHVGGDVEAARARGLEVLQHFRHASPVRLVGGLEVPHFRGNVRALGHREHFVERRDDLRRTPIADAKCRCRRAASRPSPARRSRRWSRSGRARTAATC